MLASGVATSDPQMVDTGIDVIFGQQAKPGPGIQPWAPTVAWRQDRVRFWAAIKAGAMTEDTAAQAGVSSPVGFRWFRHAGGVNPQLQQTVSGRYLSSDERENIALWRAGVPVFVRLRDG